MRTAKLFMDGSSQAVCLPDEFRFDGDEVAIRKDTETGDVILSRREEGPSKAANWDNFFDLLDELTQEERDAFVLPPRDRSPILIPDLGE